jgi:hypothetical protein
VALSDEARAAASGETQSARGAATGDRASARSDLATARGAARSDPATERARRRRTLEHWTLLVLTLLAGAAVIVLGFAVTPDPRGYGTHEQLGLAPCRFLALTGVPCPGCGVTTSIAHAARFDLAAAFAQQPLGIVVALLAPLAAAVALIQHARGRDLGETLRVARLGWWAVGLGAVALAAWVAKIADMRGG